MKAPSLDKKDIKTIYDNRFLKLFQMDWSNGSHYLVASRRSKDELMAAKPAESIKSAIADAVTCIVVIKTPDEGCRLYMEHEFRYPAGQFLLSPPAGLIDKKDCTEWEKGEKDALHPALIAAKREIKEETGIEVKDTDTLKLVTPFSFSSPGMTDESNALALAVVELSDLSSLNNDGAEGGECFDGYSLLTVDEAKKVFERASDENGMPFSIYTWCALAYFIINFA